MRTNEGHIVELELDMHNLAPQFYANFARKASTPSVPR